ncbi:MAG: RHS repeat protein [Spirochaetales bacterium]|nr:RHS repeat protein [Bacteroidales bacterium]MBN2738225.1 RHS repeat protein [Spirochaetales bacterium]
MSLDYITDDFTPSGDEYRAKDISPFKPQIIIDQLNMALRINNLNSGTLVIDKTNLSDIAETDLLIYSAQVSDEPAQLSDYTWIDTGNTVEIQNINPEKIILKPVNTSSLDYLETLGEALQTTGFTLVRADYSSSSIVAQFDQPARIRRIELVPGENHNQHRVEENQFELYLKSPGGNYTKYIPLANDQFIKDNETGKMTFIFSEPVENITTLKIHVLFDERNKFYAAQDKAEFINELSQILEIYQEGQSASEYFDYDKNGNRIWQRKLNRQSLEYDSLYYENTEWLKTDERRAYNYDKMGNVTEKGTHIISADGLIFAVSSPEAQEYINNITQTHSINFATTGKDVTYYQYQFDALNRLEKVYKNGLELASYTYDVTGLRITKTANGETIHYVYEGSNLIFEKNVTTGEVTNYVFGFGKHLAKAEGPINDPENVDYYHTDQIGSVRAVSDETGELLWEGEYTVFGELLWENNPGGIEAPQVYAGKHFDEEAELFYFNARW